MLAAGTVAAASNAAFVLGLPVIVPNLREEFELSLGQIGVALAAIWIGPTLTLLPWGLAADRAGERVVLTVGLLGSAIALALAATAASFAALVTLLGLAAAAGASVNSSSARAVMHWFDASERGFALGIRQTAIPLGGLIAALALPHIAERGGTEAAFLFLGGLAAAGGLAGALVLRRRHAPEGIAADSVARTLVDRRLWRLSAGSGLYLYAQMAVLGFGVLFLVDEHGFSKQSAALVLAGAQVLGAASRIGGGRWSDRMGLRVVPLRRTGIALAGAMLVTAALTGGPIGLLVPALILAGGLSMAWNGLSFTAAAELAGPARTGAAIGLQQTALGASGVVAPLVFAATVSSGSWAAAFGLAGVVTLGGWALLGPLDDRRHTPRT